MKNTTTPRPLQLTRPLAFIDLETTGLDVKNDRIVELAVVKLMPDGERQTRSRRLNPGIPIPPGATAIHGIRDADVADCPRFEQVARGLFEFLSGCDLGGYNFEGFDLKVLTAEFQRCRMEFPVTGVRVVDPMRIFRWREGGSLSAAVRFYCGRELENAHSAEADILATIDVLHGQLARYDDLGADVDALHAESHRRDQSFVDEGGKLRWRADGLAVFSFGKHAQRSLQEMVRDEPDYLRWMLGGNFSADLKSLLTAALEGRFPTPPTDPIGLESPAAAD